MSVADRPARVSVASRRQVPARVLAGKLGAAATCALPGGLAVYLSFHAGGYFPGPQGVATAVLAASLALRMLFASEPFASWGRRFGVGAGALALYAGWVLLSCRWSHAPARALLDFNLASIYLCAVILFGSFGYSRRRVRWTVVATGAAMLVVCIVSVATRLRPDLFPVPATASPNRLSYPLEYWNALGIFAVIGGLIATYLTSTTREPRPVRVLAAAALPVFAVTILLTYSRAALVLGFAAVALYLLLARPRGAVSALIATGPPAGFMLAAAYHSRLVSNGDTTPVAIAQGRHLTAALVGACLAAGLLRVAISGLDRRLVDVPMRRRRLRGTRGLLPVGCVAVAAAAIMFSGPIVRQLNNFTRPDSLVSSGDVRSRIDSFNIGGRIPAWRVALEGFAARPVLGSGAGTFNLLWERQRADPEVPLEANSLYFEALSELGIVGLLTIAVFVVSLIVCCLRRRERSTRSLWTAVGVIAVVWAAHAAIDYDWEIPAVTLPVVALAGCGLTGRPKTRLPRRAHVALRGVIALAATAIAVTGIRIGLSDQQMLESARAISARDCGGAISAARSSLAAVSSRPQPYSIIGYCEVADGSPSAAVTTMRQALARDPADWRYHYGLAIALASAGRDPVSQLRAAHRLAPEEQLIDQAASVLAGGGPTRWRRRAGTVEMPISRY